MNRQRKLIAAAATVAVLVAGIAIWRLFLATPAGPQLVTATAANGDIEKTVVATGTLEPKELVSVGAQVSGRLEALHVALGQTVKAGDLIAQIDAQTQTNALKTSEAALANIEAQRASRLAARAQADLAFRRQQTMVAGEATSRADYEAADAPAKAARADVAAFDAQIAQAKVSVDTARVNLGYTRISAPMDGVVVAVVTKQGQTVNANQSAPTIVILAKLDVMIVKAQVSEADVIKVKAEQTVYFTILGDSEHRYYAKLNQIEPAPESIVNEVSTTSASSSSSSSTTAIYYNALFDVPNADGRLRALMTAQVSIVLDQAKGTLIIPSAALGGRGRDGKYNVKVVDENGRATPRQVQVGINNNVSAQIVDGLKAGENVVIGEAAAGAAGQGGGAQRRTPRGPMGF
jgi:macrolide-specific efflux system membrane fusion protein